MLYCTELNTLSLRKRRSRSQPESLKLDGRMKGQHREAGNVAHALQMHCPPIHLKLSYLQLLWGQGELEAVRRLERSWPIV